MAYVAVDAEDRFPSSPIFCILNALVAARLRPHSWATRGVETRAGRVRRGWGMPTEASARFAASITAYLSDPNSEGEFVNYDFGLPSIAVPLVYAYGLALPVILWVALRYLGVGEWSVVEAIAIWGYGMFAWIPVFILAVISSPPVRWSLVGIAFALSGWFLVRNVYPILASSEAKATRLLIVIIAALHAGLASTFKEGSVSHRRTPRSSPSTLVAQSDFDKVEDFLLDIADPRSPNYGQHWSPARVKEAFRPSTLCTRDPCTADNIRLNASGDILELNVTVAEAEHLLEAEYCVYSAEEDGSVRLGCHTGVYAPRACGNTSNLCGRLVHFGFGGPSAFGRRRESISSSQSSRFGREAGGGSIEDTNRKHFATSGCDIVRDPRLPLREIYNFDFTPVSGDVNSVAVGNGIRRDRIQTRRPQPLLQLLPPRPGEPGVSLSSPGLSSATLLGISQGPAAMSQTCVLTLARGMHNDLETSLDVFGIAVLLILTPLDIDWCLFCRAQGCLRDKDGLSFAHTRHALVLARRDSVAYRRLAFSDNRLGGAHPLGTNEEETEQC
ncbi:Pro-kumamolisin, activation domain-containing protein [Mycena leptocephala]|nr:Pro-kumamolisin, activation domain-containing protein [Mycena leptocephala]